MEATANTSTIDSHIQKLLEQIREYHTQSSPSCCLSCFLFRTRVCFCWLLTGNVRSTQDCILCRCCTIRWKKTKETGITGNYLPDLLFVCPPDICPGHEKKCVTKCHKYNSYSGNCFPNLHRNCTVVSRCSAMEARLKDFEEKKIELDLWASTWDGTTQNKLRYFVECLPANGLSSMRKGMNWGTDPNRRNFIFQTKSQLRKENRHWFPTLTGKKISWKKKHLSQIDEYINYVENRQKIKMDRNLTKVKMVLIKQRQRESSILKSLENIVLREARFKERKRRNHLRRLEIRRQNEQKEKRRKQESEASLDDIFAINLDFSADEIMKLPLVFDSAADYSSKLLNTVEDEVPSDFLQIGKGTNDANDDNRTGKDRTSSDEERYDFSRSDSYDEKTFKTTSSRSSARGNKSPDEWFYPPKRESENSDYDPFWELKLLKKRDKSSTPAFATVTRTTKEEEDKNKIVNRGNFEKKDTSEISDKNNTIYIESDSEDNVISPPPLSEIFLPCQNVDCCLRLTSAKEIEKPISCLSAHISEMAADHGDRVFGLSSTCLQIESLSLLVGTKWLNDEIINVYGLLLSQNPNCYVFNTRILDSRTSNRMRIPDLLEKKVLFFPINSKNMHWYLICLWVEDKSMCVLDSLGGEDGDVEKTRPVLNFLSKITNTNFFRESKLIKIPFSKQKNSYDCGLYVCVLMKIILFKVLGNSLRKEDSNVLKFTDMTCQREVVLSELFCGKIFPVQKSIIICWKDPLTNEAICDEEPLWLQNALFIMEAEELKYEECFPSLEAEALNIEHFHSVYFVMSSHIYALWTDQVLLSKEKLESTLETLTKAVSNPCWPVANYRNISGFFLNCACWQGKAIQIRCWSLRQKFCKKSQASSLFYKTSKWQVTNTSQINTMSASLEILAVEANRLLRNYDKKIDGEHLKNINDDCTLFPGMSFTNVDILCDFACHTNPLLTMKENTSAVAFFLAQQKPQQWLGFPTYRKKLKPTHGSVLLFSGKSTQFCLSPTEHLPNLSKPSSIVVIFSTQCQVYCQEKNQVSRKRTKTVAGFQDELGLQDEYLVEKCASNK